MKTSPVLDDPRHYQSRDGAIRAVSGTHDEDPCATCRIPRSRHVATNVNAEPDHLFAPSCETCAPATRTLATKIPLGALVEWPYGHHGRGRAHGRVIGQAVTRLEVYWHTRKSRPTWISAKRITATSIERVRGCAQCGEGK